MFLGRESEKMKISCSIGVMMQIDAILLGGGYGWQFGLSLVGTHKNTHNG